MIKVDYRIIKLDDGILKLDDGIIKLYDGIIKLYDGMVKLDDGIIKLDDGNMKLDFRVIKLDDGIIKLYDEMVKLDDDGMIKLDDGMIKLDDGIINTRRLKCSHWQPYSGLRIYCCRPGFGSAFIFCGSGFNCFFECGSGSSCFFNADPDPGLKLRIPIHSPGCQISTTVNDGKVLPNSLILVRVLLYSIMNFIITTGPVMDWRKKISCK